MMIAKYCENYYNYSCDKKLIDWKHYVALPSDRCYLVSNKPQKLLIDFLNKNGIIYKNINEEELTDIFYIECWVGYDTGLPNIPTEWLVQDIDNDRVKIEYGLGVLPGWGGCDKYVSFNYISKEEITSSRIVYVYTKKDGKRFDIPYVEEKSVSIDELLHVYEEFSRNNL